MLWATHSNKIFCFLGSAGRAEPFELVDRYTGLYCRPNLPDVLSLRLHTRIVGGLANTHDVKNVFF